MNNRFIDKARGGRRQMRVGGYMRDRRMSDYRGGRRDYDMYSDYRRDYEDDYNYDGHYGRHEQPMPYEMSMQRRMPQYYRGDYNYDYGYDYGYDYASGEEDYKKELEKWSNKLKQKDRFNLGKEEVIRKAKEMQVKFDEFSEEEFYAVYLMILSDFKNISNDPHMYIKMAKDWLMDDDIKVSPSEKVWLYYHYIVSGKE